MRCKVGDLAVVVRAVKNQAFLGRLVRCLRPTVDINTGEEGWVVEPPIPGYRGIVDSALRPIRGNDARDESLAWKDVPATPHKEHA